MFTHLLLSTTFVLGSLTHGPADQRTAGRGATPRTFAAALAPRQTALTNADVIEMIKAGLPESTIILAIQKDRSALDTSAQALIQLKKQGATQRILDAMLQPAAGAQPPAAGANGATAEPPSAAAAPGETPIGVILIDGTERRQMLMSRPDSRVSTGGMMRVVNPLKKMRVRNVLAGNRSQIRVTNPTPVFEASLMMNVNPSDHLVLVKLNVASNRRELDTGRSTLMGGVTTEIRDKDKVAASIEEVETRGQMKVYRIRPSAPLPPGEYAVLHTSSYYDFGVDGR